MENEFDINKVTAEFAKASLETISISIATKIKDAKNSIRSKFKSTYKEYLQRLLDRNTKTKSFFSRAEPHFLYDVFVPLDLSNDQRILPKASIKSIVDISNAAIIFGSGGCGKSMLMRHFLLSAVSTKQKIPIFLELRQLNSRDKELRDALLDSMQSDGLDVNDKFFEITLKVGHYCILLDGFDELDHSIRNKIANQIQNLLRKYPNNWFIISSREDSSVQGWTDFTEFQVDPLSLEGATDLVKKLSFDESIKSKFIKDLERELFVRHKSFLSNPLLLSIMLLTYSEFANIPDKLSLFYSQAYESLFQKHDALKGGYQRQRKTLLDIQEFAKVFSALSILSYEQRDFSFSQTKLLDYIEKAKNITQLSFNNRAYLDDVIQSVCLMIQEGIEITFAHRSFQEYFVALFIESCPSDIKGKLIEKNTGNIMSDSVISLLYEIDPISVERYYILPTIDELRKRIRLKNTVGLPNYLRFIQEVFVHFDVHRGKKGLRSYSLRIRNVKLYEFLRFFSKKYGTKSIYIPAKTNKKSINKLNSLVIEASNDKGQLRMNEITSSSIILKLFSTNTGLTNINALKLIFQVEKEIRKRHKDRDSSIISLLGIN